MSAPVSIIIPTLNAAEHLPRTLAALVEGMVAGLVCELVVVDGGSTDATTTIAEAAGARIVTAAAGRGVQLAAGAATAKGDWLFFVHADSRIEAGWAQDFFDHISGQPDRAAVCRLRFDAKGRPARIVAGWANLRTRLIGLPYGDQGLLIRRTLYDDCGGFPEVPLMEDVAIARALKGRITPLATIMTTGAEKYTRHGWARQGSSNLVTLVRYLAGQSPDKLAARYSRRDTAP